MNQTEFAVQRFTNRNGVTSWRVSGWLHGLRIRKNFKTREEAAAEKASLEIKSLQVAAGLRPVMTTLTEAQVRDAEAAFRRLADAKHPLAFYLDFAVANYREPENEKKLSDAILEYVANKEHEHQQDLLSLAQLSRIRRDLKRLNSVFPTATVAELSGPKLMQYFETGRPSKKTFNNRRGIVSTLLKYAYVKGWIAEDPLKRIPAQRIRRRRSSAKTLTADAAREMMHELEPFEGGRWVPFFALTLFAGIRPAVPEGEIARLVPTDINLGKRMISIRAEVAKTREPRKVTIQPNLAAWLQAYPLDRFPLIVPDFYRRRAALSKRFGLTHDVLRHTFISMFVAKFRSVGEAALQAGNSESIIRSHYLEMKSPEEADAFFGILPSRNAEIIPMPSRANRDTRVAI